jgi:Ca2+-binding EF-hand superfamily protein
VRPADHRVQFAGLWNYIKQWQEVFRRYDADSSGTIDQSELG